MLDPNDAPEGYVAHPAPMTDLGPTCIGCAFDSVPTNSLCYDTNTACSPQTGRIDGAVVIFVKKQ